MSDETPVDRAAYEISNWETFVASDGILSIRMRASRTPQEIARDVFSSIDLEELTQILAENSPCRWSIPEEGHPHTDACLHKRFDEGHGVCWNVPYAQAEAVSAWLNGETK